MIPRRAIPYAALFAGWFLLWPVMSYMGGQGYTVLVGLLALPVLLYARPSNVPLYAGSFALFIGWAIVTSSWSPAGGPLITGHLLEGNFSVNAASLRIGLAALAMVGVVFAMSRILPGRAPKSLKVIVGVGLVQGLGVVATALFMPQILSLLAPISDPLRDMPQNLMSNTNSFVLILPLLLSWLWFCGPRWGRYIAVSIVPVAAWAAHATGSDAAVLAIVLMLGGMGVSVLMPRYGLSALLAGCGAYVLFAPIIVGRVVKLASESDLPLALSAWSRVFAWDVTCEQIAKRPVMGGGLEASETWRQTYGGDPERLMIITEKTNGIWRWENYPIVPGHPHNMPLQIWADSGFIGAGLCAVALFALAVRLGPGNDMRLDVRLASAGLIGAGVTLASVSHGVWNEAFWAGIALMASAIILFARQRELA